jgi:hypothetical protein
LGVVTTTGDRNLRASTRQGRTRNQRAARAEKNAATLKILRASADTARLRAHATSSLVLHAMLLRNRMRADVLRAIACMLARVPPPQTSCAAAPARTTAQVLAWHAICVDPSDRAITRRREST